MENLFYRIDKNNNAVIFNEGGTNFERFEDSMCLVYPVNSGLSCYYEHNDGIILTIGDTKKCGIVAE